MKAKIRSILDREIKMTMGCTDPGSIAYAASKAASVLDGELKGIDLVLSKNIYKNAVYVGVPVIKKNGIEYAALLGAMIKKPELKLAVLSDAGSEMLEKLDDYLKSIPVDVKCSDINETLFISVTCYSSLSKVNVIIKDDYDRIYHIEKDNKVLYHKKAEKSTNNHNYDELSFKDIYLFATDEYIAEGHILEYEKINKKALLLEMPEAFEGYRENTAGLNEAAANDIANMARAYVFNVSKLRMSGEKVPIVSVAGSGNLGIESILAVSAVCDMLKKDPEERERAILLSVLTAIFIKSQMNRLTVMCGTAIAGAAGAAAATTYLLGGGYKEAEEAVNTVLGSIGGILCDGAKESCAFKVSFSAGCAVMSGVMAVDKRGIKPGSGIITHDIDENIKNIGKINNVGMKEVDNMMLNILSTQKSGSF